MCWPFLIVVDVKKKAWYQIIIEKEDSEVNLRGSDE